MTDYAKVETPVIEDEPLEDVHLDVLGIKLDLPNLNSADLPIDLVNVILLIKSHTTLSEEQSSYAMSAFLAYFQQLRPDYWNATLRTWAEQSGLDPKALALSSSGKTTAKH